MACEGMIEVRDTLSPANRLYNFLLGNCLAGRNPWISNHSYDRKTGWGYMDGDLRWFGDPTVSETEDLYFGHYSLAFAGDIDVLCHYFHYHLPVYAAGNDRFEHHPVGNTNHLVFVNGQWVASTVARPPDGDADGYDTLNPYAVAKNILTVGAIRDLTNGFTFGTVFTGAVYSSCGPTDDGRIKPDVVASGESIYSLSAAGTNAYRAWEGTSFSAPAVAGSLALLQELHQTLATNAPPLLASSMKAVVIHTADDADGVPGPDYRTGWGVMNTARAAALIATNAVSPSLPHIKECMLADGDSVEFGVTPTLDEAVKVTICWTDPVRDDHPYELNPTNSVLTNDLDLRVIDPYGVTNYPWVLNPLNPTNAATTGDNIRDNVEQVWIESPTNGTYVVRVTHKGSLHNYAYSRYFPNMMGTNAAVQDVSIVISGSTISDVSELAMTNAVVDAQTDLGIVQWPGVVGAIYAVEVSTNLLVTNGWEGVELIQALREDVVWTEPVGQTSEVRFYRFQRER